MKRFLTTTALVLATSGAVFAQDNTQLKNDVMGALQSLNIEADVSTLTDAQLSEIFLLTNSSDSGKKLRVQAAISDMGMASGDSMTIDMTAGQLRNSVSNQLTQRGIEADVSTLSHAQLTEIYLLTTGSDMEGGDTARIEEALTTMQSDPQEPGDDSQMVVVDMNDSQLRNTVGNILTAMNIDADASTLTNAQLAEVFLLANTGMDNSVKAQIEAAIQ